METFNLIWGLKIWFYVEISVHGVFIFRSLSNFIRRLSNFCFVSISCWQLLHGKIKKFMLDPLMVFLIYH